MKNDSFTRPIHTEGRILWFTFEPVNNELLNGELSFIVTGPEVESFSMAYDKDELRFKVQRPAPYIAYEFEQQLGDIIESHYE